MHTPENTSVPLMQRNWFKFGLYGAAATIALTIILYVIDEKLLFNRNVGYISLAFLLAISVWAAVDQKNKQGGYIQYSTAVVTSLGSFVTGLVISMVFSLLMYFVIDTSLLEKATQAGIAEIDRALEKGTIKQEQYDAAVEQMDKMGSNLFLFQLVIGTVFFSVLGLIIFLISSAIIKKESAPAHHTS